MKMTKFIPAPLCPPQISHSIPGSNPDLRG